MSGKEAIEHHWISSSAVSLMSWSDLGFTKNWIQLWYNVPTLRTPPSVIKCRVFPDQLMWSHIGSTFVTDRTVPTHRDPKHSSLHINDPSLFTIQCGSKLECLAPHRSHFQKYIVHFGSLPNRYPSFFVTFLGISIFSSCELTRNNITYIPNKFTFVRIP